MFLPSDADAAQHALDFAIGWYADPVYLGEYPAYMRQVLGDRLPEFTQAERALVWGSSDFYGMNTYTTNLCSMSELFEVFNRLTGIQGLVETMNSKVLLTTLLHVLMAHNSEIKVQTPFHPPMSYSMFPAHCAWLQDCKCT